MRSPLLLAESLFVRSSRVLTLVVVIVLGTMPATARVAQTPQLTCTPTPLHFGAVTTGGSEILYVTLNNNQTSNLTISSASASNANFSVSNLTFPLVITGGESVTVAISFAPTAAGYTRGQVVFRSNASDPTLQVEVGGTGVAQQALTATPAVANFGTVAVGKSVTVPVVLTNKRSYSAVISSLKTTGSEFSINGPSMPMTLKAGQSITVNVTFAPTTTGFAGGDFFVAGSSFNFVVPYNGTGGTAAAGTLAIAPAPLNFGNVNVGTIESEPITVSASGASVTVSSSSSSNSLFNLSGASFPMTIAAGQSVSLNVVFAPKASGAASGTLSLASNASNSSATESLSGTGTAVTGTLAIAPAPLSFGSVNIGTTATQPITVSASGASVTVSSASSSNSSFTLSGASFPLTIASGQSVSLSVAFAPKTSGAASGTLSLASNASNSSATESLSGTGAAAPSGTLAIAPAPLSFGSVSVGSSQAQPITVSASGASVTVSSASSSNSLFTLNGASFPMTVAAGQSVSLSVVFAPTASGSVSGTLSLASNASNNTATESLSGTGTPDAVTLSWTPSTSPVVGYNVYRGTAAGGPFSKVNSSVDSNTSFTDSSVAGGTTYYYVATSVNSAGVESSFSSPALMAIVP